MTGNAAFIGVFDSGIGGLSVLRALWAHLPAERFRYLADSANCPYGGRRPAEIQALALGLGHYLADAGAKLIVVACNTMSATALPTLREHLRGIPIVGLVPAVKPAVALSHTRSIGVLATEATVHGDLYLDLLRRYARGVRVTSQACPGLVDLIEAGRLEDSETEALLRRCVAPMVEARADVIVMGCSHYPFVSPLLQRILGPAVRLIEPSDAVALQTRRVLEREGLLADEVPPVAAETAFATTGDVSSFEERIARLAGVQTIAESLVWSEGRLAERAVAVRT